jgi:hypothetical protein
MPMWVGPRPLWSPPAGVSAPGLVHAVAPDTRATMPAPRRGIRSTPDGGSAVQPPGLSYTVHWEVLGCALCLLTSTAIPRTGPVWARGFCPGSRRPRARVPLVVWAWDLLLCGFFAAVSRPPPVFRSAICDCLSLNVSFSLSWNSSPRGPRARRPLLCLARNPTSLTPSPRSLSLPAFLAPLFPSFQLVVIHRIFLSLSLHVYYLTYTTHYTH